MNTELNTLNPKIPQTEFPVSDFIKNRWSARSFSEKNISEQTLFTLLEAARWAPSSNNEQPWLYTYAHRTDKQLFDKFHSCLLPGNQPWAKNASVLMLNCARTTFSANGKTNAYAWYDCGAANVNLLNEATLHGIYGHLMGGFDAEKTKVLFHLPGNIQPVVFIALGYLDAPEKLDEPFKTREITPRSRKLIQDFLF